MDGETIKRLQSLFDTVLGDVLGLRKTKQEASNSEALEVAMRLLLEYRAEAKARKDFATSDRIRDALKAAGIEVQDGKEGATWKLS